MEILETWLPIVGFEDAYEVSSLGRIRGVDRTVKDKIGRILKFNGKILSIESNLKGYKIFRLWSNNKRLAKTVHRLVAVAHIPNPNNLPQINHIDGDKSNNSISNLEWISNEDNYNHAIINNLHKNCIPKAVNQYTIDGVFIKQWNKILDAAKTLGIIDSHISNVCKGKRHTCGGFKWEYVDNTIKKD